MSVLKHTHTQKTNNFHIITSTLFVNPWSHSKEQGLKDCRRFIPSAPCGAQRIQNSKHQSNLVFNTQSTSMSTSMYQGITHLFLAHSNC